MSNLEATQLFSVKDRVVVITGGGSGLGRIVAKALAINGASKIFVLGRREDALRETASQAGPKVIPVACDVTSKESLEAAYQAVAAQTSHVDILFANSGTLGSKVIPKPKVDGSLHSLSEIRDALLALPMKDFTNVLNVNVTGAYYTVVAFLPLLEAANQRRPVPRPGVLSPPTAQVIITSSIAAFNRNVPNNYAYNTSKAAVTHLVKSLSTNFLPYHIRVNGIAPGLYHTEMSDSMFKNIDVDGGIWDNSVPANLIPLTRSGSEEDFAGLFIWMASASGGYINGTIIVTDGGRLGSIPSAY
ncbi:Short-chain dehydrogenase/reductase SAT3 [Penicillium taxi]|uniref:Short-chain dehydrogenase/reductase SAT3 n=1 Tax=Penicillium taxi TaxID=168475 RepID=UPI0025452FBE|nr:Short-chain dehydrogenase/reductase SAT3 [Penicillium taxi]KAJ5893451.1 Short-chain dehydrogenase/reductase SAT3 [Penicillium taxi]